MRRREFLYGAPLWLRAGAPPVHEAHFPNRLCQFVWRNWELANTQKLAEVIGATARQVLAIGKELGLPPKRVLTPEQLRRIYVTVIRQNWDLLPESQIIALLGWDKPKFEFTLKEDDFLDIKLGPKPDCPPLRYEPLSDADGRKAREIAAAIRSVFGPAFYERGEPPFHFVRELSRPTGQKPPAPRGGAVWSPRFLYSFLSLYGDPLLEPEIDPLPEGYLERLAAAGIDGVWMQAVLNTLAPARRFPEFGQGSETRLRNLERLVERCRKFCIRIYLYINEPRAMPESFFRDRPGMKGSPYRDRFAMCTSVAEVREWLADSLAYVFRRVGGLGGMFSITMSENHTNCFSHGGMWGTKAPVAKGCPRCSKREAWETLAELLGTFRDGVRAASGAADIIAWDWAWPSEMSEKLIPALPRDVKLMSVSEWYQPVNRGGVKTRVNEYSISVVGPGPRALANWGLARKHGIKTMAKTQFNNTWEISAVPYIPVPHLVLEHCANLVKAGVSGVMPSWTCGGYPSPNLEAARMFYYEPRPAADDALAEVARRRFGEAARDGVVTAWRKFSEAFIEFPYGVQVYLIPTQHGPANLLRLKRGARRPAMILFPSDALKAWCGPYPPEAVRSQFTKLADKWLEGLNVLRPALAEVPAAYRANASTELAVAETCYHHFRSVANQVEFYMLRDSAGSRERMKEIAESELDLARRQYTVARRNSVIAFESSNHYYYTPLDLAEKVLNCRQVIEELSRSA